MQFAKINGSLQSSFNRSEKSVGGFPAGYLAFHKDRCVLSNLSIISKKRIQCIDR